MTSIGMLPTHPLHGTLLDWAKSIDKASSETTEDFGSPGAAVDTSLQQLGQRLGALTRHADCQKSFDKVQACV